ncbi:MAG: nucleotidyltransferase domain-containing protein [bacterium]
MIRKSDRVFESLKTFFANKSEISMAFLFGSAAVERQMDESDVDVAVWFDKKYSQKDVDRIWLEIEQAVVRRNIERLTENVANAVGLRNFLAHQYLDLKWEMINSFLNNGEETVKQFAGLVQKVI